MEKLYKEIHSRDYYEFRKNRKVENLTQEDINLISKYIFNILGVDEKYDPEKFRITGTSGDGNPSSILVHIYKFSDEWFTLNVFIKKRNVDYCYIIDTNQGFKQISDALLLIN